MWKSRVGLAGHAFLFAASGSAGLSSLGRQFIYASNGFDLGKRGAEIKWDVRRLEDRVRESGVVMDTNVVGVREKIYENIVQSIRPFVENQVETMKLEEVTFGARFCESLSEGLKSVNVDQVEQLDISIQQEKSSTNSLNRTSSLWHVVIIVNGQQIAYSDHPIMNKGIEMAFFRKPEN